MSNMIEANNLIKENIKTIRKQQYTVTGTSKLKCDPDKVENK